MTKEKVPELTSNSLQQELWNTLQSVKSESIDLKRANTIYGLARGVLAVVKTDLQIQRFGNQKGNKLTSSLMKFTRK
jgi:hypothetical protein